jgi:hypothetical protein
VRPEPEEPKKFIRLIVWVLWSSKKLYDWWNPVTPSMSLAWRLETLIKFGIVVGLASRSDERIAMEKRTAAAVATVQTVMQYS